jgi:hypothetical protein
MSSAVINAAVGNYFLRDKRMFRAIRAPAATNRNYPAPTGTDVTGDMPDAGDGAATPAAGSVTRGRPGDRGLGQ